MKKLAFTFPVKSKVSRRWAILENFGNFGPKLSCKISPKFPHSRLGPVEDSQFQQKFRKFWWKRGSGGCFGGGAFAGAAAPNFRDNSLNPGPIRTN